MSDNKPQLDRIEEKLDQILEHLGNPPEIETRVVRDDDEPKWLMSIFR